MKNLLKVSDLIKELQYSLNKYGDTYVLVHNDGSLGDIDIILEKKNLKYKRDVLIIE